MYVPEIGVPTGEMDSAVGELIGSEGSRMALVVWFPFLVVKLICLA